VLQRAADQYLTLVMDSAVDYRGIGALRTLTGADGRTIVELLVARDEVVQRLSYALLSDTPFRDCLTTVTVHDLGLERCEVVWSAAFQSDGLPANEAVEMLEGAFESNSEKLRLFLAASAS